MCSWNTGNTMSVESLKTRATRLQVPKTPVYTSTCSGKSYYLIACVNECVHCVCPKYKQNVPKNVKMQSGLCLAQLCWSVMSRGFPTIRTCRSFSSSNNQQSFHWGRCKKWKPKSGKTTILKGMITCTIKFNEEL